MSVNTLVTYSILIGIILFCLFTRGKKETFNALTKPGAPTHVKAVVEDLDTVMVTWMNGFDPLSDPINGHTIMITTAANPTDGSFLRLSANTKCEPTCTYKIDNLSLKEGVDYNVAVMAHNKSGSSDVSPAFMFKAIPQITPTPEAITEAPTEAPTPSPTPMFADEVIKREKPKSYFDKQLEDMVARAEGVFEWNTEKLEYPKTFVDDVKQSVQTLNDEMLKDLQEYRVGIHLAVNKGK